MNLPANPMRRRQFLRLLAGAGLAAPLVPHLLGQRQAMGAPVGGKLAKRLIIFYFPDGVPAASSNGEPSLWHPTGTAANWQLPEILAPLQPYKAQLVVTTGLTMGPTDAGSHPGGAKKLLTAVDGGGGVSIDQYLAKTVGNDVPVQHLYLGAQATVNGASGDKFISYPAAFQTAAPQDNPLKAFAQLFGTAQAQPSSPAGPDPDDVTVVDTLLADLQDVRNSLGQTEKTKLDLHLDSVHQLEKRIKQVAPAQAPAAMCAQPKLDTSGFLPSELADPARFPAILKAQIDLLVLAMACGLTRVGTLQASQHTSELIMSRFAGTPMYDPGFDMRSHQASHYGPAHDLGKKEFKAFVQQRTWWVGQFAYLLAQLAARPEDGGTMLDHSLVLLCSEVCDGNTHLHDNMPFVLAGGGSGTIKTGQLLQTGGAAHGDLLCALGVAMGAKLSGWGQASKGPLAGLLA